MTTLEKMLRREIVRLDLEKLLAFCGGFCEVAGRNNGSELFQIVWRI
jgi:hypothetical protein